MSIAVDIERVSEMASREGDGTHTRVEDTYERLKTTAENGDIEALYELLGAVPKLLEHFDDLGVCETPLHLAAANGHTHYVLEMMTHKPSMAFTLNPSGFSPLHLAIRRNHTRTVRGMISLERSLVRVKGKGRLTPLHQVAQLGNEDLVSEFLVACPESVEDLSIKLETVVHVALKNNQIGVFKVLSGWLKRINRDELLNWKDEDGNAVLHIAASMNQTEVIKSLRRTVKVNAKNLQGKTAMDILRVHRPPPFPRTSSFFRSIKEKLFCGSTLSLAGYLSKEPSSIENWNNMLGVSNLNRTRHESTINSSDSRSVILVVAILIVTATYQAGLSPPGGYWQENSKPEDGRNYVAGQTTMRFYEAVYFYTLNGIAFFSSLYVILILIVGLPMWQVLFGSTASLGIANVATFINIFPDPNTSREYYATIISIVIAYPVTVAAIVIGPSVAFLINKYSRKRVDFPTRYFSSPHEA